ncbi:MAG: hypothetical protein RJA99_3172 [Pseudomonadota bacterium]|jgi:hypothetical protein
MAAGAFAGLVDGFVRGYERSRDWAQQDEDRKFQAAQRERMLKQQQQDDEFQTALRGIQPEGTSNAPVDDPTREGVAYSQPVTRSAADVRRDTANVYRRFGRPAEAEQMIALNEADTDRANTRRLTGFQITAAEAAQRRAAAMEGWQRAGLRYSRGDLGGALRELSTGYESYPDGRKLVVSQDGRFGLATPDGKWVEPPVPVTRENVEAALTHAQRFLDPSAWAQFQGVRQGDQKIADEKAYREFMQKYYGDKLGLERDEYEAKKRGGMFQRPPTSADIFNPIGVSDDGRRILGRVGSGVREVPVPEGYSGLFPKVTGEKGPRPAKFLKGEDGTHTAHAEDGRPLYNVVNGGLEAPLGVDNTSWARMQREASKAGVRAALGKGPDGAPAVAFIGRDGLPYSTLEEAAAAKPGKK